jgi:hypothetical protein
LFGARRTALGQSFEDQLMQSNRQAALMGRAQNDPILKAKLAQEQIRQQAMLDAEQGGLATQLAMQLPGQRLGFAQQRSQILGGLATQAMANRQALAALGSGIMNSERGFRLDTGLRFNTGTANTQATSNMFSNTAVQSLSNLFSNTNSSQTTNATSNSTGTSGGGFKGAVAGGLGGAAAGIKLGGALGL